MTDTIVVWDTEFTSWEGCNENGWDETNDEYKELIQISAIRLDTNSYTTVETFDTLIRPRINEQLSDYIINLTGIKQEDIDGAGVDIIEALDAFVEWVGNDSCFSWGDDSDILTYNIDLYDLDRTIDNTRYYDIRPIFAAAGVPVHEYTSGTVYTYFDVDASLNQHNALDDSRSLAIGLEQIYTE